MKNLTDKKIPPSREIAYIAVMCAILIGGQYVFSYISGVEIITLLLACFSYAAGARRGALCAVAFSLLRCILFGFEPKVIILYLLYYPAFAAAFGALGHIRFDGKRFPLSVAVAVNIVLIAIAVSCAVCYALDVIKISAIYRVTVQILLWVIFALCASLAVAFDVLYILNARGKNNAEILKVIFAASVAAVFTICFTLIDDILTPLFYGLTRLSALTYFYASFTAMLPQTVCAVVSVGTLFLPLTELLRKIMK